MYDTLTLDELYDLHTQLSADHTARHARLMDPALSIFSAEYAVLSARQDETDETASAVYAEITRREQEAPPMPETVIPVINWHTALAAAIDAASPGDVIIIPTKPMLRLAECAAQRMGRTGIIFKVAEVPGA